MRRRAGVLAEGAGGRQEDGEGGGRAGCEVSEGHTAPPLRPPPSSGRHRAASGAPPSLAAARGVGEDVRPALGARGGAGCHHDPVTTFLGAWLSIPRVGVNDICQAGCSECSWNDGHVVLPQTVLPPEARPGLLQVHRTNHTLESAELNQRQGEGPGAENKRGRRTSRDAKQRQPAAEHSG